MATTEEYIQFVVEQIPNYDFVRYRKMFGEYMVYVNDKPLLLVCNNTVFVKKLEPIAKLMQNADVGIPYKSAKEHYLLDIEDTLLTENILSILEKITPIPKKKKNKGKSLFKDSSLYFVFI